MDEATNPYAPGAGTRPPELAGRDDVLKSAKISIQRVQGSKSAKSFIFIGLRGVGKTVMLNEVQRIAADLGCKSIHIEAHDGKSLPELLAPGLRTLLLSLDTMAKATDATRRSLRVLKNFFGAIKLKIGEIDVGLGMPPETGAADSGDLEADLFLAVGDAAKSRAKTVVITIDELQYLSETELSALIMAVHAIAQKALPVLVVGAGLPQLVGQMGASKSYAERLFNFPKIGPLEDADARAAISEPATKEGVKYTKQALDEIIRVTEGYPYFLQEWGYHAWNIAN
jgi:Cdc6-like AAA superfamily ATPase